MASFSHFPDLSPFCSRPILNDAMPPPAELALIDRIRRGTLARTAAVNLGIGDDCAILRVPSGQELLVTTDFSLEGRHFRLDWHSPESVGHRCLARGLSDIAAMGGKPMAAFLSIALPAGFDPAWLDRFLAGFHALAKRFHVELAGGDTAEAPGEQVLADIVLTGAAPIGKALRRSVARVGDVIYVSGWLGGSAAELARLATGEVCSAQAAPLLAGRPGANPQSFPEPRLPLGQHLLRRGLASACMDLSDGLSTDLNHLCVASGVAAEIELSRLPMAPGAIFDQTLNGGEDYELLFTAPSRVHPPRSVGGVPIRAIGRIVPQTDAWLVTGTSENGDRREIVPNGWEHFRSAV
jgi:thiamine-monophosphate kinase